jgi:hypothetical protein
MSAAPLGVTPQLLSRVGRKTHIESVSYIGNPESRRGNTMLALFTGLDPAVKAAERWQVIDLRLTIFRTAMNAAFFDVMQSYTKAFDLIMPWVPFDLPNGVRWTPPDSIKVAEIGSNLDQVIDRLGIVGAYAHDFRTEMQNALLGPLFGNQVPPRQPIDSRYVVITLKNDVLLAQYFEKDTAWGRNKGEIEASVRANLRSG